MSAGEPFAACLEATGRLLFEVEFVFLPGLKSPLQFHHGIASAGEVQTGICREMALLRITIDDVRLVLAQSLEALPFFLGKVDGARNVAFGEVLRRAHIYDDEIVFARFDPPVQFNRPGGKRQFIFEVSPGPGRIVNPSHTRLNTESFG